MVLTRKCDEKSKNCRKGVKMQILKILTFTNSGSYVWCLMAEEMVNKYIILRFVYESHKQNTPQKWELFKNVKINLAFLFFCVKIFTLSKCRSHIVCWNGRDFRKNTRKWQILKTWKTPQKSGKKIGIRHVLSWLKWRLEPKFQDSGTFGGWEKMWTNRQTDKIHVL